MCSDVIVFFFFKQKTAYEMRISDWSSDVCSSDLLQAGLDHAGGRRVRLVQQRREQAGHRLSEGLGKPESLERRLADEGKRPDTAAHGWQVADSRQHIRQSRPAGDRRRSEEHTSELQSLMRISYAVFCLKKKTKQEN